MAWLKSNLNNVIISILVLSNNSSKTRKITAKFSKTMKVVFFDSKTHSIRYTNMRMKTVLYQLLENTWKNVVLYLIQKHATEYKRIYFIHER